MEKDVIIFCQSPRDLTKVVSLYEENKGNNITIFVINVYGNYTFLKNLNLNAKIIYIPHKKIKNPFNLISMLLHLRKNIYPVVENFSGAEIFFFSQYFDYVTGVLIERLKEKNTIYFIDNYKQNLKEEPLKLIEKIFLYLFKLFFKTQFFYSKVGSFRAYFFKLPSNTITTDVKSSLPKSYKQNFANPSEKNLLLFEGRGDLKEYFIHYEEDFEAILDTLPKDYKVYIKPHPRLNYSPFIDRFDNIHIINKDIPSEFLNEENFTVILGIETTATADFFKTKIPTFSLIPIFSFKDNNAEFYSNHLNNITEGKAKYITSIEELNKMLS